LTGRKTMPHPWHAGNTSSNYTGWKLLWWTSGNNAT
jgi:hypothetical protein